MRDLQSLIEANATRAAEMAEARNTVQSRDGRRVTIRPGDKAYIAPAHAYYARKRADDDGGMGSVPYDNFRPEFIGDRGW